MKQIVKISFLTMLMTVVTFGLASARSGRKALLGVQVQTVDRELAKAFDLPVDQGAIVNRLVEGSPADRAGLREDDIIIALNGSEIRDEDDLIDMVAEAKPGEEVTLKIIRGDEEKEVDVTLGRWRGHDIFKDFALGPWKHSHRYSFLDDEYPYIGVKLLNISGDLASNLGAEDHGVLIDRVTDDSPAETAGLKAGDVIVSVDNEAVYDVRDVQQSIRRLDEGEVTSIHIVRNRKQMTVEIEVTLQEDRAFSGEPSSFRWIDLPPFRFWAPKMKGLHHGLDLDLDEFDSEESYDDMEELQEEFKELKKELRELKKSLQ